jgi:DNA-binding response OmpR family regulator
VDDEAITRDVVVAMLELDDVEVHHASDGEAALKVAADVLPDVVLLDVMMPGMNGFDVCRALLDVPEPPRVVMLTARADPTARATALEAGAAGYLVKPFSARDLFRVIDEEPPDGA